ncbi:MULTISPECIES: cytochrome c oxidase subunit II [unclassified Prochlorococcus]|uniref:cytochrome c oxidase subunit II n=1 Tax=unclassified Prochlorococcus TaxID=2627481 RepID=UPI0005338B9A|nr:MULTISPECIES: cytochrome c oxidase subunit II [unclassified Prochlorococcus]KGG16515.1 Cytochrome c oxidase polypeptide II [Prochlorococcus sp. MIT 0602]KGG17009.1 Cytochrome c oxidase polypeptide II [Prochlorococcus sp. MIT 0603]
MLPPTAIYTILISIALIIASIWANDNFNFLPDVASANAPIYDELFKVLFVIGIILFVGITALVVYSLIQFRRKPGETEDGLPIEDNLPLEILWTAIPAIVVLFVGLYSYDIYERMGGMQSLSDAHGQHSMHAEERIWGGIGTTSKESAYTKASSLVNVELTAMQFAFLFNYPEGGIISGELHVPAGQPVSMRMESKDVIHAFWVPEFRLKQDVIPGQPTVLNFTPTKPGRYPIICAELCGPYHGGMRSTVVVEEPEEYQAWFKENSKQSEVEL